jgi:hypothetical protein
VDVTPQGIDDRINAFSVVFLRAIFLQALEIFKNRYPLPLSVLQRFSAINIVDISTKSLPENMANEYPGCGRVGAKAALKIQLIFDFLHGNLKQVEIETGEDSDQGYREYLKVREHAKKRGTTLSQTYLFMLGWTLFVTNAPDTMITVKQACDFYRIRWQIELIFKLWKSYCGLNHIQAWRKERVLTELYAKLIGIVIVHFLLAPLRIPDEIWSEREVSNVRFKKKYWNVLLDCSSCTFQMLSLWQKLLTILYSMSNDFLLSKNGVNNPMLTLN